MRGLPGWMLALLVVLSVVMIYLGWVDRHEVGPVPFILGIVWGLFTLASLGAKARYQFAEEH